MSADLPPFHLAIPVHDLDAAREFYCTTLGCGTGRTASRWIDLDFFGHQVTLHLVEKGSEYISGREKIMGSEYISSDPGSDISEDRGEMYSDPIIFSRPEMYSDPFNPVDGDDVPSRHFGVVLPRPAWEALAARLEAAGTRFLIAPRIRFAGQVGEQATMFLRDPSGNALEFKSFADPAQLFAT